MVFSDVRYSKGQMKIQQMAFVLVAMMIFFALVALVFAGIYFGSLQRGVDDLREQEAKEAARKISGTPEFAWTTDGGCAGCIDMDKAFMLKSKTSYSGFWRGITYLQVTKLYPSGEGECTAQTYPDCGSITIVDEGGNMITHSSFVALCRFSEDERRKCELGKVIAGFEPVNR
jgi:hypothetical protein